MNEDVFNTSLRGFLKKVGIASQREIANLYLPSLRARRSNPSRRTKKEWIASSLSLLAMTGWAIENRNSQ
jgi:hypothetical protein